MRRLLSPLSSLLFLSSPLSSLFALCSPHSSLLFALPIYLCLSFPFLSLLSSSSPRRSLICALSVLRPPFCLHEKVLAAKILKQEKDFDTKHNALEKTVKELSMTEQDQIFALYGIMEQTKSMQKTFNKISLTKFECKSRFVIVLGNWALYYGLNRTINALEYTSETVARTN